MTVCSSAAICRSIVFSAAVVLLVLASYVAVTSAANDELTQLGLGHVDIIGTRFIDEHHDIHDYPESKSSDKSDDKSDYHNPIYDHVNIHKDDYSHFGGGHESSESKDSHEHSHGDSHDKSDDHDHSHS